MVGSDLKVRTLGDANKRLGKLRAADFRILWRITLKYSKIIITFCNSQKNIEVGFSRERPHNGPNGPNDPAEADPASARRDPSRRPKRYASLRGSEIERPRCSGTFGWSCWLLSRHFCFRPGAVGAVVGPCGGPFPRKSSLNIFWRVTNFTNYFQILQCDSQQDPKVRRSGIASRRECS